MSERQGYGWVQTLIGNVFTGSTVNGTSSIDVSEYNETKLQLVSIVSQSATQMTSSVIINSSLNGLDWIPTTTLGPHSSNSASLFTTLSGRRCCIQALLSTTGNITSSLYILAGQ